MKKELKIIMMMSIFLTGCGIHSQDKKIKTQTPPEIENQETDQDTEQETDQVNQNLEAWFPKFENEVYYYEGINNEFAELIITPQFTQENYFQTVTNNDGTTIAEVYEYKDDEIIRVFARPETYFRDNFMNIGIITDYEDDEVILKKPIAEGTTWENEDREFEITAIEKEITVPAGTYTTIEVTENTDDITIKKYYAEDMGLIYEVSETGEMTIESKLENIKEASEEIALNVFVADEQAEGLIRYESTLELKTNDPVRFAIENLLNGENEDYPEAQILPDNTEINHMFLNNENIVEIDLSKEFEDNMHAGSTGELFIIYGLVNTITEYYGVEEILLTIEGKPYESGHTLLKENETLSFDQDILSK